MRHFDHQLSELQNQVFNQRRMRAKLEELQAQSEYLRKRIEELSVERQTELEDVERLEKHSLSSLYYRMIGKKDEKLQKERKEAYAAAVKYDTAVRELEELTRYIEKCEMELAALTGCEDRYAAVLKEKEDLLKLSGGETARRILTLEKKIGYADQQENEIREALDAGRRALGTAEEVIETLDSAESWSTWDMLGGGLLTDMAKYEELDQVQDLVERLQGELHSLKTELSDVDVYADISVEIDGFLQFADFFFDGFFADLAVREQIHVSQEQAEQVRSQIQVVLARLEALQTALDEQREGYKKELESCVLHGSCVSDFCGTAESPAHPPEAL
ncbi:MAG: hypothetical protein KH452_11615 [Clostridiales bacterium]|nr:hypothetical protein [Clostridiales bacterium]